MITNCGKRIQQLMRGYWILLVVLAFGLLSIYTSHPIYGAPAATPTPNVNTVPKPVATPTPENTPFPTPTSVSNQAPGDNDSATPPGDDNQGNDNEEDDNQGGGDNQGGDNQGGGNQGGGNQNSGNNGNATTGGGSTDAATGNAGSTTGNAQQNEGGVTAVVNAVTLNLRKGPDATTPVIDTLFLNDQVTITARNQTGDWLYVCCGERTKLAGWVSKQFLSLKLTAAQVMTMIPMLANSPGQSATMATATNTGTKTEGNLVLEMRPLPSAVWQGQTIDIQFVVRNRSSQPLTGIQLRNDLPAELAVVNTRISNQGKVTYNGGRQNGPIITIDWPTVQANGQITATVTVQIAPTVADGALIDNLAVVKTREGAEVLAGITLAMPPVALPQFREP